VLLRRVPSAPAAEAPGAVAVVAEHS
jgi:hypothetical protein